jgi:NADH:ubiquinone oxidoreductase subunit E
LYFKELKEEMEILNNECGCYQTSVDNITFVVDEVVGISGREQDKVIMILQEVQKRLNFLPSEALRYICKVTEITPEQISGVSTFYSQFRHLPVGKHIRCSTYLRIF